MSDTLSLAASDLAAVPEITPGQELAGAPAAVPVKPSERIPIVDVIRGFALLGILLMNIPGFGGPLGITANPTSFGHHHRLNLWTWVVIGVLFEGKMRGAFSMLFGAGTLLLTDRAEARGLGARVGEIFARRNMWLILFGVLDGYLLWFGDILYWYGVIALLFLYPFRRATPRTLWIAGVISLSLVLVPITMQITEQWAPAKRVEEARNAQKAGKSLTTVQSKALEEQRAGDEKRTKRREDDSKKMRGSYWEITQYKATSVKSSQSDDLYLFGFGDALGMMLIGMALLRTGFLTGSHSNGTYLRTAAICYAALILVAGFGFYKAIESDFNGLSESLYIGLPNQFNRLIGTLANISVVIWVVKNGWVKPLTRGLAAVGQMALTNYILTSVLCAFYFYGYGLKQYGRLEFYQLYYVVAAVWVVLIAFSTVWLRQFQFGPVEWLWRSLTYWKRQPFRRVRAVSVQLDPAIQPAVS